jgi:hypothetical protein
MAHMVSTDVYLYLYEHMYMNQCVCVHIVSQYLETKLREGHNCFEVVIFHGTHGKDIYVYEHMRIRILMCICIYS